LHPDCTPVRLSRAGCSRQFGRASALTIPQLVHTILDLSLRRHTELLGELAHAVLAPLVVNVAPGLGALH
jgi:hypothetical protein